MLLKAVPQALGPQSSQWFHAPGDLSAWVQAEPPPQGPRHCSRAAGAVELELPITALVEELESELIKRGYGDDDVSALHRWSEATEEA